MVMVPVAVAVVITAPLVALDTVTVKVLSNSGIVSPCTLTVIVLLVSPTAKLTVPLGKVLPLKSALSAALVPLPVTAQFTAVVPAVPARVMVKVKGLVPLFPSVWFAVVAAMARVISSLVMVPVTGVVVPILYPVPATSLTITVSLGSGVVSRAISF